MQTRRGRGFSLTELLVCVAIVAIIMSMYLPALSRALTKAKQVKNATEARDRAVGRMADHANSPGRQLARYSREECRAAFRQKYEEQWVSEVLYNVTSDDEFAAYWNTLLNPKYVEALQYDRTGLLSAHHPDGRIFGLRPADPSGFGTSTTIIGWSFISTDLKETTSGTLGGDVLYGDGRLNYVRYPDQFPMTPTVAKLSHQFVLDSKP